jgi:hypothetical protein
VPEEVPVLFKGLYLSSLETANSLFVFHAALFAFGYEPSFATHGAQDTALDYLFAEAFEQLVLGLTLT